MRREGTGGSMEGSTKRDHGGPPGETAPKTGTGAGWRPAPWGKKCAGKERGEEVWRGWKWDPGRSDAANAANPTAATSVPSRSAPQVVEKPQRSFTRAAADRRSRPRADTTCPIAATRVTRDALRAV